MSQVTKPIALDETLQDVVTAIQGITQGGMIVSTGTVGSATQPVYIDGGVPTAGSTVPITVNDGYADFASLPLTSGFYHVGPCSDSPYPGATVGYWDVIQIQLTTNGTRMTQIATQDFNGRSGKNELWLRSKHDTTWGDWARIGGGIITGTPTVNATYVTSVTARWLKSGNVVELRIQGLTTTTGIPWKTLLSGLPKPVQGIGINNVFFETPVSHSGASVGVAAGRITDQGALMITETPSALTNVDINLSYMTND